MRGGKHADTKCSIFFVFSRSPHGFFTGQITIRLSYDGNDRDGRCNGARHPEPGARKCESDILDHRFA